MVYAHATPAADFLHRALRTPVLRADPKDDRVDETECMVEHQALDLTVRAAAPMSGGDEGPTDLDLRFVRVVAVVAA